MRKAIVVGLALAAGVMQTAEVRFRHHFITRDLPQAKDVRWGYGTPVLADLDRDGDLDFAVCAREEKIYWFENQGKDRWVRRVLGDISPGQLGATALDVDRDGWTDVVIGGYWYRNSRDREKPFTRYQYDSRIKAEIHDIVIADVDGDRTADVIVLGDRDGCFWYKVPRDPARDADWDRTLVTDLVLNEKDDIHGGIYPAGAGDLDRDGDVDLVFPDRWLANRGKGTAWEAHPLPLGKRGPWGLSARSWIVDLDKDGDQDIVIMDADQKDSRGAWLESDGKRVPGFTLHLLPKTAPGVRGSFHSLAVADFDGDGDLDIVTVEQEDESILPEGAAPRWYMWENVGGKFVERVILDAWIGGHDIRVGDIDGDGDPDIASKIWRRWSESGNGGKFHADWMENTRR